MPDHRQAEATSGTIWGVAMVVVFALLVAVLLLVVVYLLRWLL